MIVFTSTCLQRNLLISFKKKSHALPPQKEKSRGGEEAQWEIGEADGDKEKIMSQR